MSVSRRSSRLGTKDLPDDDAASTSSTGSNGQVSYRETPVRIFKRKTGSGGGGGAVRKTAGSSRTSSRASSVSHETSNPTNEPPFTDRYSSVTTSVGSTSALRAPLSRSGSSSTEPPHHRFQGQEAPGFSSGYSSSEEAYCRPSVGSLGRGSSKSTADFNLKDALKRPDSKQSSKESTFDWKEVLRSPGVHLVQAYWWLGAAWYSLTSGISVLDVFLLSRRTAAVRKAILQVLVFLLLIFGIWICYAHFSRHSFSSATVRNSAAQSIPAQHSSDQPIVAQNNYQDMVSMATLSSLKEEIYRHLKEQEGRLSTIATSDLESLKRDMALLKQEEEKHKQIAEVLQSDVENLQKERLQVTSVHGEQQRVMGEEMVEVQQQISQLRTEVSHLRLAADSLQTRVDTQEGTLNKVTSELREELTSWLLEKLSTQQQKPQDEIRQEVVLKAHLQVEVEALEQRLLHRLAEEREKSDTWRTVGETLQQEGMGAISVQDVERIVHRALSLYRADGIGMPDYALESAGASVINTRCSETYRTRSACLSLFGFPLWYHSESPRTVIQPELYPGKCWAFRGAEGFLVIALSYPVRITHVTLEHLPRILSPTGRIDSAPRSFAVYGVTSEREEGNHLGTFTYDQYGEPIQTFPLPAQVLDVYRMVELRILSNWGHPEYTCVYRFRVHGDLA